MACKITYISLGGEVEKTEVVVLVRGGCDEGVWVLMCDETKEGGAVFENGDGGCVGTVEGVVKGDETIVGTGG